MCVHNQYYNTYVLRIYNIWVCFSLAWHPTVLTACTCGTRKPPVGVHRLYNILKYRSVRFLCTVGVHRPLWRPTRLQSSI